MASQAMPFTASEAAGNDDPTPRPLAHLTRGMVRMRDDAWTEFHHRYFARLFRYALTLHRGDRASAEDSVQSGFLRAVRHIRRFECEENFWSWLTLLVRCAAADQGRRFAARTRLLEKLVRDTAPAPPAGTPNPDETTFVLLGEALSRLPENDRGLLDQKYTAGLSTAELAAAHRTTEKAIECRLRRLRKRLKSTIDALSKHTRA